RRRWTARPRCRPKPRRWWPPGGRPPWWGSMRPSRRAPCVSLLRAARRRPHRRTPKEPRGWRRRRARRPPPPPRIGPSLRPPEGHLRPQIECARQAGGELAAPEGAEPGAFGVRRIREVVELAEDCHGGYHGPAHVQVEQIVARVPLGVLR